MLRKVDILSYYPEYLQKYREYQKIADAENPEFQIFWDSDEMIRLDTYIMTAGNWGLARYEKLLGIVSLPGDDPEVRRMRILAQWNRTIPYTYKYFLGILETVTGGNFEVIPDFNNYEMTIIINVFIPGVIEELRHITDEMIPCNIKIITNNMLFAQAESDTYIGSAVSTATAYHLS